MAHAKHRHYYFPALYTLIELIFNQNGCWKLRNEKSLKKNRILFVKRNC